MHRFIQRLMTQPTEYLPKTTKKQYPQIVAFVILLLSLAYLLYHLLTFDQYELLLQLLRENAVEHKWWLAGVLLLLPLNQYTEALKWKTMTRHVEKISLSTALKSVLAGAATGFITPNRLGDIVGRTRMLSPENRNRALSLAITGSVTQNLAIVLPGIPALIFFLQNAGSSFIAADSGVLLYYSLIATLLMISIPIIIILIRKNKQHKLPVWLSALDSGRMADLLPVFLLALLRYSISCLQLWMILQFAGISLTPAEALKSIFVSYLFITFTPSFALSEGIVRASVAMFFIGFYAGNNPAIALAGAGLWLINVVLPVLAGNIILFNSRRN
jgi:hypothetical protein